MKTLFRSFIISGFILIIPCSYTLAQVGINTDGSQPDSKSMLDVKSSNKGFLLPRMTFDQRNSITSPPEGMMVFCTNCGLNGSGVLCIYSNSTWNNISFCTSQSPAAGTSIPSQGQIIWNWNAVPGSGGYKWNSDNHYDNAVDMGMNTTKTETGLDCDTNYSRYVWSYNGCSVSPPVVLTGVITAPAVAAPVSGINTATKTLILWSWNAVAGATGYKWNTTNDYNTALEMGTNLTYSETGLTCGTSYTRYVWAYNICHHSSATPLTYSTLDCWLCGEPIVDSRDGKTYTTAQIGNQCWLARNLNVGTKIYGAWDQSDNAVIEKYCYADLESNCDIYGGLYQWRELMNYTYTGGSPIHIQGICPAGWHVPSDAEWCLMEVHLDPTVTCSSTGWNGTNAGGKLKEAGTTHWVSPNTGATNSSGFTALPGGDRYTDGNFYGLTTAASFWTDTEYNATNAWDHGLSSESQQVYRGFAYKGPPGSFGLSARCIKD